MKRAAIVVALLLGGCISLHAGEPRLVPTQNPDGSVQIAVVTSEPMLRIEAPAKDGSRKLFMILDSKEWTGVITEVKPAAVKGK